METLKIRTMKKIPIRSIIHLILNDITRLRYLIPNALICLFFAIWLFLFYSYKLYRHITSPIWKPEKSEYTHKRTRYSPADHGMYNSEKNRQSSLQKNN